MPSVKSSISSRAKFSFGLLRQRLLFQIAVTEPLANEGDTLGDLWQDLVLEGHAAPTGEKQAPEWIVGLLRNAPEGHECGPNRRRNDVRLALVREHDGECFRTGGRVARLAVRQTDHVLDGLEAVGGEEDLTVDGKRHPTVDRLDRHTVSLALR